MLGLVGRHTSDRKLSADRLFLGVSCQTFFRLNPTAALMRSGVPEKPRNVLLVRRTGPSRIWKPRIGNVLRETWKRLVYNLVVKDQAGGGT